MSMVQYLLLSCRTEFQWHLIDLILATGVDVTPVVLMRLPPMVIRTRWVSFFCSRVTQTILAQVIRLCLGILDRWMKKMVLVPFCILVPTPWANRPVSFAKTLIQTPLSGFLMSCSCSSNALVVWSRTAFIMLLPKWLSGRIECGLLVANDW